MRNLPFLILLTFILSGCNPVKNKKVDQATISFKTDDSSKLFFKNMRRSYYDVEIMEEAKLEVYRLKDRVKDSPSPVLNLSIVNNWRYDEAYILLEPNQAIGTIEQLKLEWKNTEGTSGQLNFEGGSKTDLLAFATKIYEQVQNGSAFFLTVGNKKLEILNDSKSREAFRITMFDYMRLVRSL